MGFPNYQFKQHFVLACVAEIGFLLFKEQFPWEFEKKISAVQRQMKAY
jgi:hypothetical protein